MNSLIVFTSELLEGSACSQGSAKGVATGGNFEIILFGTIVYLT